MVESLMLAIALGLCCAAWLLPPSSIASAQNQIPSDGAWSETLRYTTEPEQYPFRAVLEEIALLGMGLGQYLSNHAGNSVDWDYQYNWTDFRSKISGSGYSVDTNAFDTNFITHPASGTMYYWAARGNRLPVLTSALYAFTASLLWELLGEFREKASVNDMLVTPVAGLVLGETTFQLGTFFDRSCASTANRVLGALLGASKTLHDAIDGVEPSRDVQCDQWGLSRSGTHEFRLALGEDAVVPLRGRDAGSGGAVFAESRFELETKRVALSAYGQEGHGLKTFSDGNASDLWLHTGLSNNGYTDFTLGARVMAVGMHFRSLAQALQGVVGDEMLFGLQLATEYSVHRYSPGVNEHKDRVFTLDVPGVRFDYRRHQGAVRWELGLSGSVTWAGIDAFALPTYLQQGGSVDGLTSVAAGQGYNYAAGFTLEPSARLVARPLEMGVSLQGMRLWGLRTLDRDPDRSQGLEIAEARYRSTLWIAFGPLFHLLRLRLWSQTLSRWGSMDALRVSRGEFRLGASAEALL